MYKAGEVLELFEKTGVGPEHVSRAIRKAIESRRPSARYVAPWRTYIALWFVTVLPTSWVDFAFVQALSRGMSKKPGVSLGAPRPEPRAERPEQVATLN